MTRTAPLILATRNAGKIRELNSMLQESNMEVLGLEAFPELEDVEETGSTFEENALLKASYVAKNTGNIAIADDSGLEVDALQGAPGVYSARYAEDLPFLEEESKDEKNIRKLLAALGDVKAPERTARFVCVMAVCKPTGEHFTVRGTWEGSILTQKQGENGFGYDPVFFDADLQCSAAEMSKEEKNARSHRGNALRKMLIALDSFL